MAHKNKKPTNQCFWRVGLGNLKLIYDLSPKSPIARLVRHTTCATSARTTPHLATIQHTNNTLPEIELAVNPKRQRPCSHLIRLIATRFMLQLIRPSPDIRSAFAQSNTPHPAQRGPSNVRSWDFIVIATPHWAYSDTPGP